MTSILPETGLLRVKNIVGDPKASPPVPAIINISRATLYRLVRAGKFPKPSHALGPGITVWRAEDVRKYLEDAAPKAEAA